MYAQLRSSTDALDEYIKWDAGFLIVPRLVWYFCVIFLCDSRPRLTKVKQQINY